MYVQLVCPDFPNKVSNNPRFLDCEKIAFLEIANSVVKAKINFLISASRLEILFNTNISLVLLRRLRPNPLRKTLLYATQSLQNVAFCVEFKKKDNKMSYKNSYIIQSEFFDYINFY